MVKGQIGDCIQQVMAICTMWQPGRTATLGLVLQMIAACFGCIQQLKRNYAIIFPMRMAHIVKKANISIPQTYIDAQTPSTQLEFGKAWSGTGGTAFSGTGYQAIMTHWVLSPHAWTDEELVEYFDSPIEDLPSLPLYDKVSSYIVPGVYPNLTDVKGTLSNGQLIGGEEADFLV